MLKDDDEDRDPIVAAYMIINKITNTVMLQSTTKSADGNVGGVVRTRGKCTVRRAPPNITSTSARAVGAASCGSPRQWKVKRVRELTHPCRVVIHIGTNGPPNLQTPTQKPDGRRPVNKETDMSEQDHYRQPTSSLLAMTTVCQSRGLVESTS